MSSTLTKSCRACLKESLNDFYEINKQCYYTQDDLNFCDILNFCTHLKIAANDGLPQRICTCCAQDLQQTYDFLKKVITTDKKLQSLIDVSKCREERESLKDPLENVTDSEDEENLSDTLVQVDNFIPVPLDNVDNTFEDSLDIPFMSPHLTDSDKDDSDFLISVESQIFPQGRLKCKICHKAYFTNVGLQAHMDIHLPKSKDVSKSALDRKRCLKLKKNSKVNISEIDGVGGGDDNSLDEEVINRSEKKRKEKLAKPKKMFPCQVCGKQMISASKLRYHMVMHTGEKDYLCTMCPKAYSTIYALKHHMRAHTGERPYECKFCGDRFLRPTTLKSHMRRHTGERPYGCDICGKRFIQHSSMATHMKLNHMDKTISCPYCDKKYARQTDLNTHLLSHSGDKPFACQMCPSRFTRQSNLNKHMNQHHSVGDNAVDSRKIVKKSEKIPEIVEQNQNIDQDLSISKNIQVNKMSTSLEDIFEKPSCSLTQKIMSDLQQ